MSDVIAHERRTDFVGVFPNPDALPGFVGLPQGDLSEGSIALLTRRGAEQVATPSMIEHDP